MRSINDVNGPARPTELQSEAGMAEQAAAAGLAPAVDPDVAAYMGAFPEEALDEAAAEESRIAIAGEDL